MTSITPFIQEVGYEQMDAQHRTMGSCMMELARRAAAADVTGTAAALEALWDETVTHFALEEDLMVTQGYPERDAHRAAHQLFLEHLRELMRLLTDEGVSEEAAVRAQHQVPDWFTFHVETNDAPLARFLVRKAASRMVSNALGEPGPEVRSDA